MNCAEVAGKTIKTFSAFLFRADEGALSRLVVESTILLTASRTSTCKVDTDTIALKVKQEFAAKDKAKKDSAKATSKPAKKVKAA